MHYSKITYQSSLFLLLILIVLISLGGCSQAEVIPPPPPENEQILALVFDLSSSLTKKDVNKMANIAKEIIAKDDSHTNVQYFVQQVHENPSTNDLILNHQVIYPSKRSLRTTMKEERDSIATITYQGILDKYDQISQKKGYRSTPNSCIINTLMTIYERIGKFKQDHKNIKYDVSIIILSDMIEECTNTPAGKILMKANNYQELAERITQNEPFSTVLNCSEVEVIYISTTNASDGKIDALQREALWRLIFTKMGCTDEEASTIHFLSN